MVLGGGALTLLATVAPSARRPRCLAAQRRCVPAPGTPTGLGSGGLSRGFGGLEVFSGGQEECMAKCVIKCVCVAN